MYGVLNLICCNEQGPAAAELAKALSVLRIENEANTTATAGFWGFPKSVLNDL